ncbi:MAG: hypothetical protein WD382_01150 [Halofilum sp. (in: g-proteobacteria)]
MRSASKRLGLTLAGVVGVAGLAFVAADWWWREAPQLPEPAAAPRDQANDRSAHEERVEALREAIEEQRAALRAARSQRGQASDELERMADELGAIRERLDGLRAEVEEREETGR